MIGRRHRAAIVVLAALTLWAAPPAQGAVIARAGTVEILFTPGDAVDRRIIAAVEAAREEVHVLAYSFTHPAIARALADAHRRGVHVEVVIDHLQAVEIPTSVAADLRRRGVAVWLDPGPGSAHNKVMIVDPRLPAATTVTGSFNFTRAAQSHNAENVIIFHRNRDVARIYERYFEARRAAARPMQAAPAGAGVPRAPSAPPAPVPPRDRRPRTDAGARPP